MSDLGRIKQKLDRLDQMLIDFKRSEWPPETVNFLNDVGSLKHFHFDTLAYGNNFRIARFILEEVSVDLNVVINSDARVYSIAMFEEDVRRLKEAWESRKNV